eukprot:Blabericola_migrator_1__5007@NODE_25_length_21156_cov_56_925364_g22_i0_p5_GENE_NODE_25_length_21156_cov_56_925364_g22_i0NODE_25_length_21156_cov_56_925364_g22_i0_p5_ORF_typecomplete_len373_score47_47ANAPC4_WD40/PF12894_7/0_0025ANAPC4_WD40/PF12894_7/1_7e06ANAPC4_WD40/PF12894_7/1_2WD40_like/PF17005_5/2e02WD40_like/PF17005_5/5e09WD40/PF00400_32/0_047WD40/PF00400_32/1_3e02WD40/PF00400_32/0_45WD40/PF00400_32/3e03WD40/PF00400_32/13WD40/PF00400_32/5_6e02Nup160/PF11715_8/0_0084Nup160/PF11715_8/0_6Nup160
MSWPSTHECPNPPSDSPTELSWFWRRDAHELLAASAWDGTVRIWEVQTQSMLQATPFPNTAVDNKTPVPQSQPDAGTPVITQIVPKAMYQHTAPVLSCNFVGEVVFVGGADKKVMMYTLATQQAVQVGEHESAVCKVFFNDKKNLLCSVGWDNNILWWDTRTPTPAASFKAPAQVWDADISRDVLVTLCSDKTAYAYDLNNMTAAPYRVLGTSFSHPLRKVKLFHDNTGLAIGAVEGRGRIAFLAQPGREDFNFRCHRVSPQGTPLFGSASSNTARCYCVNGLDFNPLYGSLVTVGGDGYFITWDVISKAKLYVSQAKGSFTCCKFDQSGRMLGLGQGYDWSAGIKGKPSAPDNKILICPLYDQWIQPRRKT